MARESAQYAVYTMSLAAQVRGLGARNLVGNASIIGRNRPVRRLLGLAPNERVWGLVGLGFPAVRFKNKIRGRTIPLTWAEPDRQRR